MVIGYFQLQADILRRYTDKPITTNGLFADVDYAELTERHLDFITLIAENRQSCRSYNPDRPVEPEKLEAILNAARMAPSACNGQPYRITVCHGEAAAKVAQATQGMGMNKFAGDAPVMLVLSEMPYVASAALGAKLKKNDYRSMDIGIVTAYITAEATAQGLGTCILGWLDGEKIQEICHLEGDVRLVLTLGYAKDGDPLRPKKRKDMEDLVTVVGE